MSFLNNLFKNPIAALTGELGKSKTTGKSEQESSLSDQVTQNKSEVNQQFANSNTDQQTQNTLAAIANTVNNQQVTGQTSGQQITEGGGQITQTLVSDDMTNGIAQQILGKFQGLASVAQGEKGAGLYNSTGNESRMNDLVSQVVAKVAQIAAPTITQNLTQSVTNQAQQAQATQDVGSTSNTQVGTGSTQTGTESNTNTLSSATQLTDEEKKAKGSTTTSGSATGSAADVFNSVMGSKGGGVSGLGNFGI